MNDGQVAPQDGNATQPAPGPAPIPRAKRPFRNIGQGTTLQPAAPPITYKKELGIPPLVGTLEGYKESDFYDYQYSTFVPSIINLVATWYLTCQRLSSHDRFLKDTSSWHPYMDILYLSVTLTYHILRVRREFGTIGSDEHGFLATLEQLYPPTSLHIPGSYVHIFMAITATESPYPWQSKIGPTLPSTLATTSQGTNYLLRNNENVIAANPIIALDLVYQLISTRRASSDAPVFCPFLTYGQEAIRNPRTNRHVLNSPYARVGNPASPRAEDAFWFNNAVPNTRNQGNPTMSGTWDLPQRPQNGGSLTGLTVPQYMCLVDLPTATNPSTRYRNWLNAYSSIMNMQCAYVQGSRSLNDIATVGLGAHSTIWTYTPGIFMNDDPNTAGQNGDWTEDQVRAALNARIITSLEATGTIRDPELSQIALQVSALAAVNVDMTGQARPPANATIRSGPFWNMPQAATAPTINTAMILHANVSNVVSSIVNK